MVARGGIFRPEILVFCRSRAAGSSGGFCFLNWWPNLHRSEGGGHDLRSLWWRVEAHGSSIVDDISGFCRSKSVEDSYGFSFVKS